MKGQFEIRLFNSLYTQRLYYNEKREPVAVDRATYFTTFLQALVGIHPRVNVGIDLQFRSVAVNPDRSASAVEVFRFRNDGSAQTQLASLGPKIKFIPFKNLRNLSMQSTFFIPVVKNLEGSNIGRPFLDYDKFFWWNQIFYDHRFNQYLDLFAGIDIIYRFAGSSQLDDVFQVPLTFIINTFPTKKFTIYSLGQFFPTIGDKAFSAWFLQVGVGMKYQVWKKMDIEFGYNNFVAGLNSGNGHTFNVGIRYVH